MGLRGLRGLRGLKLEGLWFTAVVGGGVVVCCDSFRFVLL